MKFCQFRDSECASISPDPRLNPHSSDNSKEQAQAACPLLLATAKIRTLIRPIRASGKRSKPSVGDFIRFPKVSVTTMRTMTAPTTAAPPLSEDLRLMTEDSNLQKKFFCKFCKIRLEEPQSHVTLHLETETSADRQSMIASMAMIVHELPGE